MVRLFAPLSLSARGDNNDEANNCLKQSIGFPQDGPTPFPSVAFYSIRTMNPPRIAMLISATRLLA